MTPEENSAHVLEYYPGRDCEIDWSLHEARLRRQPSAVGGRPGRARAAGGGDAVADQVQRGVQARGPASGWYRTRLWTWCSGERPRP